MAKVKFDWCSCVVFVISVALIISAFVTCESDNTESTLVEKVNSSKIIDNSVIRSTSNQNSSLHQDIEVDNHVNLTETREGRLNSNTENTPMLNGIDEEEGVEIFGETEELPNGIDEQLVKTIPTLRERAIGNLMKIFGLPRLTSMREDRATGPPPEFMIDLYNTITDAYGVTRAKNPYDAHVVRSFIERDNSLNDYFYFNISGISETESVLEAELHIHRMRTPHEDLHPSLYLTPFYILSLYQVLDPNLKQLEIPDLHKLLGVHYVPALGSGWEVFNVKQAVMEWMKGERINHGFLVVATSLGGDRVPIRFSRRGETLHSKQPILVLFTEDSEMNLIQHPPPLPSSFVKLTPPVKTNASSNGTRLNGEEVEDAPNIPTSSLENPRFHHALLYKDSIRHPNSVSRFRSRRSKNQTEPSQLNQSRNYTECGRHDLFVSFETIGWSSWIISPKAYNAFYCDGPCRYPLGQQVRPTNHATVQSIVHELKLSPGIERPCCVPTALLPISLLYYDDHDNVVLKQYVDMVAESCGCH